jgi:hypothetical protein
MRPPDLTHWPRRLALLLLLIGVVLALDGLLGGTARAATGATTSPRWQWPVEPAVVLRGFSADQQPYGPGHDGVDLVAAAGDAVGSAGDGVVSFVGVVAGRPLVVVQHAGNLRTTYEPVRPSVVRGESVGAGQTIGHLADRPWHCGWRPCLHWGLRLDTTYLDPLTLLDRGPPRLLPLWSNRAQSTSWDGQTEPLPVPTPAASRSSSTRRRSSPVPVTVVAAAVVASSGAGLAYRRRRWLG